MEILLSKNTLPLITHLRPFSIRNPNPNPFFLLPIRSKFIPKSKPISISRSISTSSNFGGWDDPELLEDSASSSHLDPIRRFLSSLGIDDGKHAAPFILGFLSALAVSRVRFSSMLLLPFSILVFVMGFSAGVAQIRVFNEKFADLEAFLDGLRDSGENLDLGRIKGFLEATEGAKIAGDLLGLGFGGGKRPGSKSGRKRKDFVNVTSNFVQYLGGLFQENVAGAKAAKTKDISMEELGEKSVPAVEVSEGLVSENVGRFEGNAANGRDLNNYLFQAKGLYQSKDNLRNKEMLSFDEELNDHNTGFGFVTKQGTVQKTVLKHNYEHRMFQSNVRDSTNRDQRTVSNIDFFTTKSEASSLLEETLEISNKSYKPASRSKFEEVTVNSVDQSVSGSQQAVDYVEEGKKLPSVAISVDEEFSTYMKEATELLKKARECMTSKADEETADKTLYKTARLLSAAVDMRPMSLLAVGQLGNTYLLHGELKLNISRELRALLLRSDALPNGRGRKLQTKKLDSLSREDISPVLVEVCEECEELLVEAGRKYRMALSIDGNDVRALYNWGLALSFRAQLIADIGPEAAVDADKVYLAAIDKFDAMMSRSNLYATNALYRWGLALQQRSQLRGFHNKKEKMRLLHQAKSLFEDVISMESENNQAREALACCVSELNYSRHW